MVNSFAETHSIEGSDTKGQAMPHNSNAPERDDLLLGREDYLSPNDGECWNFLDFFARYFFYCSEVVLLAACMDFSKLMRCSAFRKK